VPVEESGGVAKFHEEPINGPHLNFPKTWTNGGRSSVEEVA